MTSSVIPFSFSLYTWQRRRRRKPRPRTSLSPYLPTQAFEMWTPFLNLPNKKFFIFPQMSHYNFMRFANLTAEIQTLQINVLTGYTYNHPSMIDIVTRSPQNLAENVVAVMRGFQWTQIAVVYCEECYAEDELSSETYFPDLEKIIFDNNVAIKEFITIGKAANREEIANKIKVLETTARVVLMFLGNQLSDYVEFMEAMKICNYTDMEFTTVAVFSKVSLNGMNDVIPQDQSGLELFEKSMIIFNNNYEPTKVANFSSKFSFSTDIEKVVSLQIYEAYHLLGYYLYTAITNDSSLLNYVQPEKAIATMTIPGPFGEIFINTNGQRLAGYDVIMINRNISSSGIFSLGTVSVNKNCSSRACLHFNLNSSLLALFELPRDVPLCGFHGEICDQTGVIYAILVVLGVVSLFLITYVAFRKLITHTKTGSLSSPWLSQPSELNFIDLVNTDGSQHMSIQSLQRNTVELARLQSVARSKRIAAMQNNYVLVDKYIMRDKLRFDRQDSAMLYLMKSHLQHDNLNVFSGIVDDKNTFLYVCWQQCFRGSLHDYIFTKERQRGSANNFEGAFLRDILKGLEYLHASGLGYHGCLSLHNCLLDSHWIVKLSGYGMNRLLVKWKSTGQIFTEDHSPIIKSEELHYFDPAIKKIWKSMTGAKQDNVKITPEFGRKCDMYSFGVILYEVIFKKKFVEPLVDLLKDTGDDECALIDEENDIKASAYPLPLTIPEGVEVHNDLLKMIEECFGKTRPTVALARKITDTVLKMSGSLVDLMIKNLTLYSAGLSETIALRTRELVVEMDKNNQLLQELLPKSVANDLKNGIRVEARKYQNATILYSDIVGFTSLCSESLPMEVVTLLSGMYQRFDLIISQQGGYKMETIGDAYCVAAGLPEPTLYDHVKSIAMIALLQRDCLHQFEIPHRPGKYLNCRWGFNSGEVFSGVIGQRAPRYACFGEAVTLASKMESNGKEDRIQMTLVSQLLLEEHFPQFIVNPRGGITIDGYGHLLTYWLEGVDDTERVQLVQYQTDIKDNLESLQKTEGQLGKSQPTDPPLPSKDKMAMAKEKVMAERQKEEQRMKQQQSLNEVLEDPEEQVEIEQVLVDEGDFEKTDIASIASSPILEDEESEESIGPQRKDRRIDSQASTIPETGS